APDAPQDFAALVREARRLELEGHPGSTRLWTRIEERLADGSGEHDDELGPQDLLSAELAEQRAYRLSKDDRSEESGAELERAAGLYEGLAMPWHALSARARALAWLTASEDADHEAIRTGLEAVLAEAELLKSEAPLEAAATTDGPSAEALEYLILLYAATFAAYQDAARTLPEPTASAVQRFDECAATLRAEAERLSVPHQASNALQFSADLASRTGDFERAETELQAALAAVDASGRPWRGSRPRTLLAQVMLGKGEPAEAAELLHRAIADAARYDDTDFAVAPAYALLGHAASHLDDLGGAVRH
ncbi:hypothetical protein GTW69_21495, partial [Streptomyces sp. SID7760]|nr:hypothetical protein [Streptomyces sp. SID7760]